MLISMSSIWEDSVALIRREQHLLLPLALATSGLGSALFAVGGDPVFGVSTLPAAAIGLIGILLSVVGDLSMIALVLRPGSSVGDALRLAGARLPKMLGVVFLLSGVGVLLLMPAGIYLARTGVAVGPDMANLPPLASLLLLIGMSAMLYCGARLALLNALLVDRNPPALAAIRESFAATTPIKARIVGVVILFMIVSLLIGYSVAVVVGVMFGLLGKMIGVPLLGPVLAALASGAVSAGLSIVSSVFLATLYRRMSIVTPK